MYVYRPVDHIQKPQKNNKIKVTGEGEINVNPDTATVNFGVITEDKELIPAQQQNAILSTKVIDSIAALGISKDKIQTSDFRIEPYYDYDQGKQVFRGYKVTHILQVTIDDLSIIGKVVDTAVENGANYVANIQFTTKQKDRYYNQALVLAVNNASDKAKTIANRLRVQLVPTPILVAEASHIVQPFEFQQAAFVKSTASTPIEPGQLNIKASVAVEYIYHS